MTPGEDIRSESQARAVLGLTRDAAPSTWREAFRRKVKAAHPDQGGDSERVRLVIEAYRFLKSTEASPRARGPDAPAQPEPVVAETPRAPLATDAPARLILSIVEAFRGCEKTVPSPSGKTFRVRVPGGLQNGDVVRFGAGGLHRLTVQIAPLRGAELKGADLWLNVAVSREFLKEGGRMEVDTPLGPRKFWVSRTSAARGLYRAPGEGLPERGSRAKGHLYLKFELDESLAESPAKSLLARFASVWGAA